MEQRGKVDVYNLEFTDKEIDELEKCLECPLDECSVKGCPYNFFGKSKRSDRKEYYRRNAEKIKKQNAKYRKTHIEEIRKQNREYYHKKKRGTEDGSIS